MISVYVLSLLVIQDLVLRFWVLVRFFLFLVVVVRYMLRAHTADTNDGAAAAAAAVSHKKQ